MMNPTISVGEARVRVWCPLCDADVDGGDNGSGPMLVADGNAWRVDTSESGCPAVLNPPEQMNTAAEFDAWLGTVVAAHEQAWVVVFTDATSERRRNVRSESFANEVDAEDYLYAQTDIGPRVAYAVAIWNGHRAAPGAVRVFSGRLDNGETTIDDITAVAQAWAATYESAHVLFESETVEAATSPRWVHFSTTIDTQPRRRT